MSKKNSKKRHNTLSEEKKKQRKLEAKKQHTKKLKKRIAIGAVIAVLLVGAATGTALVLTNQTIMMHARTAMKSEHYTVTPAMMNYYFKKMYTTYLDYYSADTLKENYGLDVTQPLAEQSYDDDQSWYDYMLTNTKDSVKNLLILAEAADENGFSFTQQQLDDIQTELDAVNLSDFPKGVTKEDVKECMMIQQKATLYDQQLQKSFENTDEELETYYEENKNAYSTCDYAAYSFSYETDSTATELYLSQDEAADYAKSLNECKDLKSFQTWVSNYCKQSDSSLSQLEIQQAVDSTYQKNVGYTEGSDVSEWIFNENAAVGDTQIFQDTTNNRFTVYLLLSLPERDETNTIDVRHILFLSNSYDAPEEAKAQAESIYAEWNNGDQTEDTFAALADEYSEDNAEGGLYEDVYPGQMVTSFNDWCFDESRKPGDTDVIESTYGYHIMYFVEENNIPVWKALANSDLSTQKYRDATADYADTYKIKSKDKNMKELTLIQ